MDPDELERRLRAGDITLATNENSMAAPLSLLEYGFMRTQAKGLNNDVDFLNKQPMRLPGVVVTGVDLPAPKSSRTSSRRRSSR